MSAMSVKAHIEWRGAHVMNVPSIISISPSINTGILILFRCGRSAILVTTPTGSWLSLKTAPPLFPDEMKHEARFFSPSERLTIPSEISNGRDSVAPTV